MESMDLKSTLSASASACLIFSLPELLLLKGGKKCALAPDSGAIVFKGYIKGFFVIPFLEISFEMDSYHHRYFVDVSPRGGFENIFLFRCYRYVGPPGLYKSYSLTLLFSYSLTLLFSY